MNQAQYYQLEELNTITKETIAAIQSQIAAAKNDFTERCSELQNEISELMVRKEEISLGWFFLISGIEYF